MAGRMNPVTLTRWKTEAMVKKIAKWVCKNGVEWASKAEAERHEEACDLENYILNRIDAKDLGAYGRIELGDLTKLLLNDSELVAKLAKFHKI